MGAYSSWAAFALSHHLVVFIAARMAGIRHFRNYRILGDDIVIGNDSVAKHYIAIMDNLGVDIALQKTHRSEHFFEFAKRLFYDGKEFSPFPLTGLREVVSK